MKFYRVHITIDAGVSAGYEFFTSKREANRRMLELKDQEGIDDPELDVIEISPTKPGILRALNFYAKHPDNG